MHGRINHLRPPMNAKLPNNENAKSVSEQAQWNNKKNQDRPFPRCAKEDVAAKQSSDKQYDGGMDATTFGRDQELDIGKLKCHSVLEEWRSKQ